MADIPELTRTAIKGMFCTTMVHGPLILQVLDSSEVLHRGFKCSLLLLSDGLHMRNCYLVPMVPSELIQPEKYAIVRVNHYFRSVTEISDGVTKVFIEIDSMTILRPRSIRQAIGDPKQLEESNIVEADVLRTKMLAKRAPLTNNALSLIMAGEYVKNPVVQVMCAKVHIHLEEGKKKMILSVCDGQRIENVFCSRKLILHLEYYKLQLQLSIIQLDRYVFSNGHIVIGKMTWLNWGVHICFNKEIQTKRADLTEGCIQEVIKYSRYVRNAIVQINKIQTIQIQSERYTRKCLIIGDGRFTTDAYLSSQLERTMCGLLTARCIIRLDVYKANKLSSYAKHSCPYERSSITICGFTLLNQATALDFQWSLLPERPTLTEDGIRSIFASSSLIKPVVQVVRVNFILNGTTGKHNIRLLIYDGHKTCHAYLPSEMNYLKAWFEQLPIVRLDFYITDYKNNDRTDRILSVYEVTGLYLEDSDTPNAIEQENMEGNEQ